MDVYHLNQFNNIISRHYDKIIIPSLQSLKNRLLNQEVSLFQLNNLLFYGHDKSLCKTHIYELLRWGLQINNIKLNENTCTINNVDIYYLTTDFFIQFNFDTHLNKEKNAIIDFIKQLSSQKNVIQEKHIFILWNIENLNHQSQYRLRRIIEKNQVTTLFISFISQSSRMIDPLKSRFMMLRIPCLMEIQKRELFTSLINECNESMLKKIDTECMTLEDVFICNQIYRIDNESCSKDLKLFKIVDNELNLLFKSFSKIKNVYSLVEKTRTFIYKLIHYNIEHSLVARHILKIIKKQKISDDKLHSICNLLAKFEHNILFINICKIIHAYEFLFIELYKIIYYESN